MYNTVTPFTFDCHLVALQLYAAALQQHLEANKEIEKLCCISYELYSLSR